tara:strand:+ start:997 stop:2061 length:1065 start_codon:yes stop_codon:yes gene_type:complete
MKEFDYVILGGGCAGLSLAYELDINNKINNKKLAIVEIRDEYKRDKTWSFWKVNNHNFDDCIIKTWNNFSINSNSGSYEVLNRDFPYQTIDSGLFYKKILNKIGQNKNIEFFKNTDQLNLDNSIIFNSIPDSGNYENKLWQHFRGIEIETTQNIFDDKIFNLMDFDCEQRDNVHFFYTLPFTKNKALIETTWLSKMDDKSLMDYDAQLEKYIKGTLKIKNYKINYQEEGAIPLFYPKNQIEKNQIYIGSAGGMTRLSTGYTFLNIQDHSKYIANNIEIIQNSKPYHIGKKYEFLDNVFLNVLRKYPDQMPKIFLNMFKAPSKTVIKFLSNRSNFFEDLEIILRMPKWIFVKNIF